MIVPTQFQKAIVITQNLLLAAVSYVRKKLSKSTFYIFNFFPPSIPLVAAGPYSSKCSKLAHLNLKRSGTSPHTIRHSITPFASPAKTPRLCDAPATSLSPNINSFLIPLPHHYGILHSHSQPSSQARKTLFVSSIYNFRETLCHTSRHCK